MISQEVAFDDWEAEADKIQENTNSEAVNQTLNDEPIKEVPKSMQTKQTFIEKLKRISNAQFQQQCIDKNDISKQLVKSPLLLKSQNDLIQLSKLVSAKLKKQALKNEERVLPEAQLYTFFEEMLQYLYPNLQWQNIQYMKEKLKIMKKNRKEDQNRARKLKQKDQRLKKSHKTQQPGQQNISPNKVSQKESKDEQQI